MDFFSTAKNGPRRQTERDNHSKSILEMYNTKLEKED